MVLIRTITIPFAGDTWAVPGSQAGPPGGFPLAVAVPVGLMNNSIATSIRWRIVPYGVGGVPITDTTARVNALIAFLANDAAGNRTVSIGPSVVDCKNGPQGLGITLYDTALVGDLLAFAIPSAPLTLTVTTTELRIFADYGAVLR